MKVGDYVRYKTLSNQIKINKIKNIVEPDDSELSMTNIILYDLDNKDVTADKYIIKSSPNIIDLIEVEDYVNGYKVTMLEDEYYDYVTDSVKKIKDKEKIKIILGNEEQFYGVYAKDIKSVLTKEQFENMEYKIGE